MLGVALVCALLACPPPAGALAAGCANSGLRPTAAGVPAVASATLCLVDRVRAAHRLPPLRANGALARVAASQVRTMLRNDYFADVRPSGQTPMSLVAATGYRAHAAGFSVGETLAWGTGAYATPAHIVAEWMASPPHRELILSPQFREAGVAVAPAVPSVLAPGGRGATYAIELGVRWF